MSNINITDLLGDPERLILSDVTAQILHQRPQTLAVWRTTHRYPLPWVKLGRKVAYRARDIVEFLNERTRGAAAVTA